MVRGPYYQDRLKRYYEARRLRKRGYGYRMIGKEVKISWGTIRNWVADIESNRERSYRLSVKLRKKTLTELTSSAAIGKRLRKEINGCEKCKTRKWQGRLLVLELHHIDGNGKNNKRSNIKMLCPNCHSLTSDYRNKKKRE